MGIIETATQAAIDLANAVTMIDTAYIHEWPSDLMRGVSLTVTLSEATLHPGTMKPP